MLKKIFIGMTAFLVTVFVVFFVMMWGNSPEAEEPKIIGLSGELVKEDGVFLVDSQVISSEEPLDGLVGETVAIVGTLDEEGLLNIDQLLTTPKVEQEIIPPKETYRATAVSDLAFSMDVPVEWSVLDKSKNGIGWIELSKGKKKIELNRFPNAEDIDVQFVPISVSEESILINGFPYLQQRAIAQTTKRMIDYITPAPECLQDETCPRFTASSNEADPETTAILTNMMNGLVFLPEPQGWKLLNHAVKNSEWNLYLFYPPEFTSSAVQAGYVLQSDDETIHIQFADEIPRHNITDVGKENTDIIVLPTREEKLYHTQSPKDGERFDAMLMRDPDDVRDILITGRGPAFDAMIRTIVFEKK